MLEITKQNSTEKGVIEKFGAGVDFSKKENVDRIFILLLGLGEFELIF